MVFHYENLNQNRLFHFRQEQLIKHDIEFYVNGICIAMVVPSYLKNVGLPPTSCTAFADRQVPIRCFTRQEESGR